MPEGSIQVTSHSRFLISALLLFLIFISAYSYPFRLCYNKNAMQAPRERTIERNSHGRDACSVLFFYARPDAGRCEMHEGMDFPRAC